MAKRKKKAPLAPRKTDSADFSGECKRVLEELLKLDESATTELLFQRVVVNKEVQQGGAVVHRDVNGYSMGILALLNTVLKATGNPLVVAIAENGQLRRFEVDHNQPA